MAAATISVSINCVFAVDADGNLWGWGQNRNDVFQTGTDESLLPVIVLDSVESVSHYEGFVLAVRTDGSLWGWGSNSFGQLGLGTNTECESSPVKIMDDVYAASASEHFSVVLKNDGTLWASGNNYYGILGNGNRSHENPYLDGVGEADSNVFIKVMDNIRSFHAGDENIVAIDNGGRLFAWGKNQIMVGDEHTGMTSYSLITGSKNQISVNSPRKIMDGVEYACVNGRYIYILKPDGDLIEWESPGVRKTMLQDVKRIDARGLTVAAITNDDSLICWGLQYTRQPAGEGWQLAENAAFAAIKGGDQGGFVSYVDKQNDLYCAGFNFRGMIGNGEKTEREMPLPIPDGPAYQYPEGDYVYPPVKVLSNVKIP